MKRCFSMNYDECLYERKDLKADKQFCNKLA